MDENVGYINFGNAENVAQTALKFARNSKDHGKLVQLVYELMKQPEPSGDVIEKLLK